jgi:hypothetical protein
MNDVTKNEKPEPSKGRWENSRPFAVGLAAAGLLALGIVAGASAMVVGAPHATVLLMKPTPISTLQPDTVAAVKGKVSDIYGNKFVVQDDSGKTLVETGPRGDGAELVKIGEAVTVQGHFDNGFLHGDLLIGADGQAHSLKTPRPGPRGLVDRLQGSTIPHEKVISLD